MDQNIVTARHALKLETIKDYMQEMNFDTEIVRKSKSLSFDTLHAIVANKSENAELAISFGFIPVPGDFIETLDALQMFAFFDIRVAEGNKSVVLRLLNAINTKVAVGCFFMADDTQIAFKNVYMIPSLRVVDRDNFKEATKMFVYMYELFKDVIIGVALGEKSLSQALKEI